MTEPYQVRLRLRAIAVVIGAIVGGFSAYFYESTVNPGHGQTSAHLLGVWTAFVTALWVFLVFPLMGRKVSQDILLIIIAFPVVASVAGSFIGGIGAFAGAVVSVMLPISYPWPILPFYVIGSERLLNPT